MKFLALLLSILLLCGCSSDPGVQETTQSPSVTETSAETTAAVPEPEPDPIGERMENMTLEEKVGQLFLARCSAPTALADIEKYHLGGFVLFSVDIQNETPVSLTAKLASYQDAAKIPLLLAVDEEGGTVTRVSRYSAFRGSPFPSARELFENQGYEAVLEIEEEKALLLKELGFNVNLGPVCDITTNPSSFMYKRSFGQAPGTTGRFVMDTVVIMQENTLGSCLKHFPGYGNNTDTHTGIARDSRTLEELESCDLVPFQSGINAGCGAIMISHTIVEAFDTSLPASLSAEVHRYLRQEMGFDGVIVTDDLVMEAITQQYGAGEAAVLAVLAGNDLLCSSEYPVQYEAVLAAAQSGRISSECLDEAVRNVLQWKTELGLL